MGYATNTMFLLLLAAAASLLALISACYLWGRLIGRTARRLQRSQWRAYGAALFPFAALFASLMVNQLVAEVSLQTFFGLATPALLGTFFRWHWGPKVQNTPWL